MKKISFGLMVFFIMLPVFALAVECDKYGLNCTAEGNFSNGDIAVFAGKIIKALLSLLGVIVLIFMVYGGYLWMASGGNEQMVKKSKDILFNTIIGLIIVIAAFAITDFIMKGITGAVNSSGSTAQNECSNQPNGTSCSSVIGGQCYNGYCTTTPP